ncbi:hypothetical protein [Sinomicrobium weinanense]|uniref:MG2 domain-containing protein n=1 Tax=Sinomicrobium weinanense TaxID=2842200 RepID=A0A926JWN1_9FLAO|nr:hypothetical protein [Sinomicrobium weinanense]MBC9798552.1 hypothetical protein [Sinomicrobium weinanense]MBU3125975.1 hypothetical protein [Sinomicrobium weinanense]
MEVKTQNQRGMILRLIWLSSVKRLFLFVLLFPLFVFPQKNYNRLLDLSMAEKVYLQLTSQVYALDQPIWFKAIVAEAKYHRPAAYNGVLYVDLIGPNEEIVSHKQVKLNNGIGRGAIELRDDFTEGRYLIRAYTQWNRNFGNDFVYKAYVNLVSESRNIGENPINTLRLVEKEPGRSLLQGEFRPEVMESVDERRIPVYIDWGQGQDTIMVKRKKNTYSFEYEVPDDLDWVTLALESSDETWHSETVVLNESAPDVQFFPESGQLVHGFRNKIGFKSVGIDGKGKVVQGSIFDDKGQHVVDFKSNYLGMGTFSLEADSTRTYYAKVFRPGDSVHTNTYPLPRVMSKGSILSVSGTNEKIWIRVASNKVTDYVYVKVACRGVDYFLVEGPLHKGHLTKDLPSEQLPEGILVFTLMDREKRSLAERLFFNKSDRDRLDISLTMDKNTYEKREETKLDIQVRGQDVDSERFNMSVMAINKNHWHRGKTIRSFFLLDSELRGEIEEPDYYFREENPDRMNDLDALLLTQGWRNYKYPIKRKGSTFFWPQKGIEIKGRVTGHFNKRKSPGEVNMTLATFGEETTFYTSAVDSLGGFCFLLDDVYGQKIPILLSATDALGKKTNYKIMLDTLKSLKVTYERKPVFRKLDTVVKAIMNVQKKRARVEFAFDSLDGVTQLDEVVVSDRHLTSEQLKFYKKYGEPDVVITGDEIREKEKKWSYGLYSILMFNYGDQVEVEQFPDGFMLAHIRAGSKEPTLLIVDGHLLRKHEYEFVPHMSPKIVERVELIKYAKFFKSRYLTVFPETNPLDAPPLGHIISITTKGGGGIYASHRPAPGTLNASITPFSPIKEFYAPKYSRPLSGNEQKPDFRSLIYWDPDIKGNQSEKESISFYNGDISGEYVVIVEAISEEGHIGYQEKMYHVVEE